MNRRRFVRQSLVAGGVVLGGGAFWYGRRSYARSELTHQLLREALLPLSTQQRTELNTHSTTARDQIQRYFHGKCLNVEGFVSHICAPQFREKLGLCRTPDERDLCLNTAFCERVARPEEILLQVRVIATKLGTSLDSDWARYCGEMRSTWNTHLNGFGKPLDAEELLRQLGQEIQRELTEVVQRSAAENQPLAVGNVLGGMGESALLLLPLARLGKPGLVIALPVFFLLAAKQVWDYAVARLQNPREGMQAAISSQMALLGDHVGNAFEREVLRQLGELHTWQEKSIRTTAGRVAEERIGWI